MERRPTLSLSEWAVLALLAESPRHGYDVAAELRAGTDVGEVWRVDRQLVYRAIERLTALHLLEPRRHEAGAAGPPRTVYGATRRGRAALRRWLITPVDHLREVRSELLLKLVLAARAGADVGALVASQQEAFAGHLAALTSEATARDPVARWRRHSAVAVQAFLDELATDRGP